MPGTSVPVEVGLHQGSALGPFLFIMIMDVLTEGVRKDAPWHMIFADDVVLCSPRKAELEVELEQWREALERRGMKVSKAKTEYMCLDGVSSGSVKMHDQHLPEARDFKYLGSTIQQDGGVQTEVNRRIQCGWTNWKKMSGVLCDKRIPRSVKGSIYKTVVQPAMLYGMEALPLTSRQTKQLEVTEMRMCRWACGFTREDRVSNNNIRQWMQFTSIGVRCRQARLRWYGHVMRREDQHPTRKAMEMMPQGRRKRGRPKTRWSDCLQADMKATAANTTDVFDRDVWRSRVSAAATLQTSGSSS